VFWTKIKIFGCCQMHWFSLSPYKLLWNLKWAKCKLWINLTCIVILIQNSKNLNWGWWHKFSMYLGHFFIFFDFFIQTRAHNTLLAIMFDPCFKKWMLSKIMWKINLLVKLLENTIFESCVFTYVINLIIFEPYKGTH
jgi:hypothetical protein